MINYIRVNENIKSKLLALYEKMNHILMTMITKYFNTNIQLSPSSPGDYHSALLITKGRIFKGQLF